MERVWSKWENHYQNRGIDPKRICIDGVIDEVKYKNANPKILFIMKEVNDFEGGSLLDMLKDGPRYQMWHNVAFWAAGILNNFPQFNEINAQMLIDSIQHIAAINLKKASGSATAVAPVINAYAHQDKQLLLEQIGSIKPDMIIACGTMDQLIWLLDLKVNAEHPLENPVKDDCRNLWVVPFRHPSRDSKREETYEKLRKLCVGLC